MGWRDGGRQNVRDAHSGERVAEDGRAVGVGVVGGTGEVIC